jgi:hypothetical protein
MIRWPRSSGSAALALLIVVEICYVYVGYSDLERADQLIFLISSQATVPAKFV